VAEMPQTRQSEDEKWQLVVNRHEEIRKNLKIHNLRPLTIVITRDIKVCKDVADKFKAFLGAQTDKSREQIDEQVLVIHSDAPDLSRLSSVNNKASKAEWIFSVSMLNEGWDVKRVFQIVPHEKRAFESKLLIAQVLGRGLRVPDDWQGEQPVVTVFNHDKWADDIRHLVYEVMELEKRIPCFPLNKSEYNFELINIEYDPKARAETYQMDKKYKMFEKGFVDLSTEQSTEEVRVEFEEADTGVRNQWKTKIKHKTYSSREMAEVMYRRFEDLEDKSDRDHYTKQFPVDKLEEIVLLSLKKSHNKAVTENMRQKFLQSLGTLQRKETQVVRYDFEASNYKIVNTNERQQDSVNASGLRNGSTLFYTDKTEASIPDEAREFFEEATEDGSGYKCVRVANHYDFKTPLNGVIADHDNERRFVKELTNSDNVKHLEAWIKSTSMGFYEIDYFWKKGEHPKRGKFNPDFFVKINGLISVVEIKGDEEISDPAVENKKKYEYAIKHFDTVNKYLIKQKSKKRYKFNFLSPIDFSKYFQSLRDSDIANFRSQLDVTLST